MIDLLLAAGLSLAGPPPARPAPTPKPAAKAVFVEGTVKGPDGRPVDGATVVARSTHASWTEPSRHMRTGPDGRFRLTPGGNAPFNVRIDAKGLVGVSLERVGAGPHTVTLTRGGVIEGVVKDAGTGQPIPGARVEAAPQAGVLAGSVWTADAGRATAVSDARGRFRLEAIGRGRQSVWASARGYGQASRASSAGAAPIELLLVSGGSISGVVLDHSSRPVEGALARAEPEGRFAGAGSPVRTDPEGRFDLFGLEPGSWTVVVIHPELAPAVMPGVVVERGAGVSVEIGMDPGVRMSGRLVDADEAPVAGRILLHEAHGVHASRTLAEVVRADAGADGRFVLERVPAGAQALWATGAGFVPARVDVEPRRGDRSLDLGDVILDRGTQIRGRVKDRAGAPIAGARVVAYPYRGGLPGAPPEARTAADGTFSLGVSPPSPQRVAVTAPGYGGVTKLLDPDSPPAEFVLSPAGGIAGQVVDEAGKPIETFSVTHERKDGDPLGAAGTGYRSVSADDGRFLIEDVNEGTYVIEVRAPDRGHQVVSDVRVAAGATADLGKVVLTAGGGLRGTVVDTTGAPVAGATIEVQGASRTMSFGPEARTLSDGGGAFELRGLRPGAATVSAVHPGYARGEQTIDVEPSRGPAEVRLVLAQGGTVAGIVRGRDGQPPRGAAVTVNPADGQRFTMDTTATVRSDGSYAVERVPAGQVRVGLLMPSGTVLTGTTFRHAEVRDGETTTVDFQSRDVLVSGRLTRGGQPLPAFRLRAWTPDGFMMGYSARPAVGAGGPERLRAVTRDDGGYEMIVDAPGRVMFRFESADGRLTFPPREAEIPDAEAHHLDFDLPLSAVQGVVLDRATEQPVGGATVVAIPRDRSSRPGSGFARTAADGRFVLSIEPGQYDLTAHADGYATDNTPLTLTDAAEVRLELEPGESISGRVVDARGNAVPQAFVYASAEGDGPGAMGGHHTRADGTFTLASLKAGRYTLLASADAAGYGFSRSVRSGQSALTIPVRPWLTARVRVRTSDGAPAMRAFVGFEAVDGRPAHAPGLGAFTDAHGAANVKVPAGAVKVVARKDRQEGEATAAVADGETPEIEITLEDQPTETK